MAVANANPKINASASFTITVTSAVTPSFTIVSDGNIGLGQGAATTDAASVNIIPSGGLTGPLSLTCAVTTAMANPVDPPTCSVPAFVTITNTQAIVVPVSITTSATTTAGDYAFSVTATSASNPPLTKSSIADLTVSSLPIFTLAGTGTVTYTEGALTGNTTTVTATPFNGYNGTVNLKCEDIALTTVSGTVETYPGCTVPSSIVVGGTAPTSFTLTLGSIGNPYHPGPGVYLLTVSGCDSVSANITSRTSIEGTVGTPNAALVLGNSGSITVAPGAITGNTSTISITPSGGLTGTVNLKCSVSTSMSGYSHLPTCSVPTPVTLHGTSGAAATLTVYTTASTSGALELPLSRFFAGGGAVLTMVFFFAIPARRRVWRALLGVLTVAIIWCNWLRWRRWRCRRQH